MPVILRLLSAIMLTMAASSANAACSVAGAVPLTLATSSTFDVREAKVAQVAGTAGLSCNGSILSLLSSDHARATATSLGGFQLRSSRGVALPYRLSADAGGAWAFNTRPIIDYMDPALLSLLGILSADSFRPPLHAVLTGSPNVPAGVYEDVVTIRWDYSICRGIGLLGVCILADTGTNHLTTVTISVTVTNDCRVIANDVAFAPAPFAAAFTPVSQAVLVDCSLGATYAVAFSAGSSGSSRPWREMKSDAGDRLQYNIYRPDGTTIWDETPLTAPLPGTGALVPGQAQPFVARINPAQPTPPAGRYTDMVSVIVSF